MTGGAHAGHLFGRMKMIEGWKEIAGGAVGVGQSATQEQLSKSVKSGTIEAVRLLTSEIRKLGKILKSQCKRMHTRRICRGQFPAHG
jgi:hypothetical protein